VDQGACALAIIWRGKRSILDAPSLRGSKDIPALSFQSRALGVTKGDASNPFSNISPDRAPLRVFRPPCTSATVGVGHGEPVQPLPDMGGVHGESRDIDAPAGVTFSRQISAHSVEPTIASRSRNLLSHDDSGPSLTDEPKEVGPQMPNVVCTGAFASDRERLAGAGAGPQGPLVWPSSQSSSDRPQSSTREEVALREPE
jgi:hypothetical protein